MLNFLGNNWLYRSIFASFALAQLAAAEDLSVRQGEYIIERVCNREVRHSSGSFGSFAETETSTLASTPDPELYLDPDEFDRSFAMPATKRQSVALDRLKATNVCTKILAADSCVKSCSPNLVRRLSEVNDNLFPEQWGLASKSNSADIDVEDAWMITTGSKDAVIAVLDTGIDYTHPDLQENIWRNPGDSENGKDDDGNGFVDDITGVDLVNAAERRSDLNGHATHVAGIVAARANNGIGVAGVAWQAALLTVRAFDDDGQADLFTIIKGINYIVDLKQNRGVDVAAINASFGSSEYSEAEYNAWRRAEQAGILVIAAAGNESTNNDKLPSYPANYQLTNMISVAALNQSGKLAEFSNFGLRVDIAAPGENIVSTIPGGYYGIKSGTSMAAPFVTGVVALLKSAHADWNYLEIKDHLLTHGRIMPELNGLVGTQSLVSAGRALAADLTFRIEPPPASSTRYVSDGRFSLSFSNIGRRGSTRINPAIPIRLNIVRADFSSNSGVADLTLLVEINGNYCSNELDLLEISAPRLSLTGRLKLSQRSGHRIRFFALNAMGRVTDAKLLRLKSSISGGKSERSALALNRTWRYTDRVCRALFMSLH